jgi:UDP-N-acetylmuramoylalanine--D-glutamate ligase
MLEHLRAMRWSPHVALITMLAQDHVEWHGSVEAYLDAKRVLLAFQKPTDFAVLNWSCPKSREMAKGTVAQVKFFAGAEPVKPFTLRIPGVHNQVNAQGAFAAASCLGVTHEQAQAGLDQFKSLAHRLELVHEERGVRFYNDSIATIPEAAVAALDSFPPKTVIQIVGGRQKDLSLAGMCDALANRAKAVICIGEKGPDIAAALKRIPNTPAVHECRALADAVPLAKRIAASGDIVLLSTGCKSYDQFVNFEQRGEAFSKLVRGS